MVSGPRFAVNGKTIDGAFDGIASDFRQGGGGSMLPIDFATGGLGVTLRPAFPTLPFDCDATYCRPPFGVDEESEDPLPSTSIRLSVIPAELPGVLGRCTLLYASKVLGRAIAGLAPPALFGTDRG